MSEKRMFSKKITDSDAFQDMPLSTQALYFHLGMQADDDGFINSPKRIQRVIGATDDDFKILIAKNFIIPFESGVVVQKHWKINNYIRSDRYKETVYFEEKSMLQLKPNGSYTLLTSPTGIPDGSIDKNRLDKNRLDNSSCLKGNDKLINRLTEEESSRLFKVYADADWLIDEVQAVVDKRKRLDPTFEVEKPFQYIVGYAEKKGWQENEQD